MNVAIAYGIAARLIFGWKHLFVRGMGGLPHIIIMDVVRTASGGANGSKSISYAFYGGVETRVLCELTGDGRLGGEALWLWRRSEGLQHPHC